MRSNSAWGGALSAVNGIMTLCQNSQVLVIRFKNQTKATTWTVQFIDGVRLSRFYYNVSLQTKDGRYKLTVTPAGSSGYANDHIQNEWSQCLKGKVKSMYASIMIK